MSDQPLSAMQESVLDLLVVGAGPTGLACAIEAQKAGFRVALVDKGCICNSIFHYPAHMTFFTTSERLEIGGIPFPSPNAKPTRGEALEYYRQVAAYYRLDVRQYHRVERVTGADGAFNVHTVDRFGRPGAIEARKLAISTGYYDLPNWMDIPGETLSKVHHYYHDPHPFYGMDVVVIGGKNSAAIAALELWRSGARVTLVYRGPEVTPNVKYWIKPDIENRIKDGEIKAYFSTEVVEITPDAVVVDTPTGRETLPNDFVFAMTGYHPDFSFLERVGVRFEGEDRLPVCNPETLESNVPGIYLAGVIVAGARTSEIFIENGRFHGKLIATSLVSNAKVQDGSRNAVAATNSID
ncbi:MAG: YpdA family putative bacillithiol disulfide reductase [Terracidiphilus sp.]|jgi:thioredoxin reductase (NADPH)